MKFCKKGGDKLIVEKTFTVETRLNQKQNQEIIDYAREFNALYSKVLRFAWHRYNNGGHFDRKKSEFNTLLQKRFNINKRMANSVICEIQGTYNALRELQWYQFYKLKIINCHFRLCDITKDKKLKFSLQIKRLIG